MVQVEDGIQEGSGSSTDAEKTREGAVKTVVGGLVYLLNSHPSYTLNLRHCLFYINPLLFWYS